MESRRRRPAPTARWVAMCFAVGAAASTMLLTSGQAARADETLNLIGTINVGGSGLGAFDISFVDPSLELFTLADRTNASVDFIGTDANNFLFRVGGFKGVAHNPDGTVNNDLSGPDGQMVIEHKTVWAGDGDSTVKVIDIATRKIVDTISTGGKFRADEMAWDPRLHLLAVANDADTPPFVSLINTDSHQVVGHINFDGTNGAPNATGGLEQPQWSPATGMFYLSVPQVGPDPADGGVAVIDPHSMTVVATYMVRDCTPTGLALGPHRQALLGCSVSFGTSPNVLTQTIVIDVINGEVKANITQVGGSDEVWYDRGSNNYYLAARRNADNTGKVSPILGVVDASSNTFDGGVATSTTAHSVAADRRSRHVFAPIGLVSPTAPAGTDPTNPCPKTGCIAVYAPSQEGGDDHGSEEASK